MSDIVKEFEEPDFDTISSDNLILGDTPIPPEVISAGETYLDCEKETKQPHYPFVQLFFSFDIVNSTMYKTMTGKWPLIIKSLLEDIRSRVERNDALSSSYLWRVIGDEMIFVLPIRSETAIQETVKAIFEVTQKISISLKSGRFFDTLTDQSLRQDEINVLKSHNTLSVKTAAWIATVNCTFASPYDSITFEYAASTHNQSISEFLGKDIDAGFRLKEHTQDRRLCISVELACLMDKATQKNNLHIMDYVRLKGVWNESLYPVIWYYNAQIVQNAQVELTGHGEAIPFGRSFRYDETDKNELVQKFFARGRNSSKKHTKKDLPVTSEMELSVKMYVAETALPKIITDRNLQSKIEYLKSHLTGNQSVLELAPYMPPLELHCAVVCCNVENRTVLIARRSNNHRTNPGKWEFGCVKASNSKKLQDSIKEHYYTVFGINVELVLDSARTDMQPIPIAMYELQKPSNNISKGVIFVAKVVAPIPTAKFRAERTHDKIEWITEADIENYSSDDTVTDFHSTLRTVFEHFDDYFAEKGN